METVRRQSDWSPSCFSRMQLSCVQRKTLDVLKLEITRSPSPARPDSSQSDARFLDPSRCKSQKGRLKRSRQIPANEENFLQRLPSVANESPTGVWEKTSETMGGQFGGNSSGNDGASAAVVLIDRSSAKIPCLPPRIGHSVQSYPRIDPQEILLGSIHRADALTTLGL